MKQHDVIRQSTRAIKNFADNCEGLRIGNVTAPTGYSALQKQRSGRFQLAYEGRSYSLALYNLDRGSSRRDAEGRDQDRWRSRSDS